MAGPEPGCTGLESRSGRIFFIVVVHIQCSKVQRLGVYSAVYGTAHYIESLKSFEIRVGPSLRPRASFCPEIAMIVQKAQKISKR